MAGLWRYGTQLKALPPCTRLVMHGLLAATAAQVADLLISVCLQRAVVGSVLMLPRTRPDACRAACAAGFRLAAASSHLQMSAAQVPHSHQLPANSNPPQVTLGIATLLMYVPVPLGAAHQVCPLL